MNNNIESIIRFIIEDAEIWELQQVRDALRNRSQSEMSKFVKGEWVRFPYKGKTLVGEVTRINKKTVSVRMTETKTGKIPPVIATKMTKEEIVAMKLKGGYTFCDGEI